MEHLTLRKRIHGRPFTVFQHITLSLLLFTTYSVHLSSARNETYVHEKAAATRIMPIWNEKVEKTQGKCLRFHSNRFPELFYYWPEDSELFHHCCSEGADQVRPQFKYSKYGEPLGYAIYRDVGYFDQCLPFWRCRDTYLKIIQTQVYFAYCERTDLTWLYWNRFWGRLVWKYSLLQTLLPWILILEAEVVALALGVFPFTWQHAGESPAKASGWQDLMPTWRIWLKSTWKRVLMDWGHLYLLAMVGKGIVEAMERQNTLNTMQTKLFTYSTLYMVLFVILSAASAMQQLAYWIGSATEPKVLNYWVGKKNEGSPRATKVPLPPTGHPRPSPLGKSTPKVSFASENDHPFTPSNVTAELTPRSKATYHGGSSAVSNLESQAETDAQEEKAILEDSRQGGSGSLSRVLKRIVCCSCLFPKNITAPASKLKKISRSFRKYLSADVFDMGDDYKWQPLVTQGAILFAIASFLTAPVGDDAEGTTLFGSLLGYLVQAGCLWSGIYAVFVFFQRAAYIIKFFLKLKNAGADHESQGRSAGDVRYLEFRGPYQLHSKFPVMK